ncbi:MAG: type III pantothenate kinase [Candidatus Competibacteraceae bacterium]|nr:type III pantothenate kinase [Candidatus Competibacteraceae bacterium]MBK7982734.1 type III pantothenate kinase [Candidatus Competibacteraceae bacterium]MBK8898719.1 type III pantothenate kinase [Candidatus Competibacteraceae bacterium]MBK8962519.1 type III pantothenate kinase [Candidatus Competibacteraceae bacterium]
MILLADIGNSRLKWVTLEGGAFQRRGQASHGKTDWAEVAARQWGNLPAPTRVLLVSVAGSEARAALTAWIERRWGIQPEFVLATAAACGIRNAYLDKPERLGADRWVAMIAARALTRQPCYVVDCGTAVTLDALAADGQHLGGVIVPGLRLMREALYRDTRQIPPEGGTPQLFGRNTRDCVWGGSVHAVAAAIDGISTRMMAAGGAGLRLLTGGDAETVLPYLVESFQLEAELIFQGLRVIAERG